VEAEDAKEYLIKVYPELKEKLICIPNGVDSDFLDKEIKLKRFEEKENILITVGRIGTFQKNTELLLDALKIIDLKDWKVYIIGPIEAEFKNQIDLFFKENPQLVGRVIFTGNVTDRTELSEWYNKAKVFCLTSRFEGFPIAFSEALYFGNHIISTPIASANYITQSGKYGVIAKADSIALSQEIQKSIKMGFLTSNRFKEIRAFAKSNFIWPVIIKKLAEKINSLNA
jgi:glycosyltransferase involved in cell wall biosynthesis